ncbi:MAG: NusG domain II-containing protein [Ignavibacterium sp.]|nr:NusG domain II-containing protein [Ignavibacterium sp.]MDW8376319.1 NusG domain II-containing protein [Ignavibacteriales bacterium]
MLSRRNFLKLAGLGSIAITAGYTAGKIFNTKNSESFIVHGFIPADENVILNLVSSFRNKIKSNAEPIIFSDNKIGEVINRIHSQAQNSSYQKSGKIIYRIKRLNEKINSDIIVSDASNSVYSLDDFNFSLFELRRNIKEIKADLLFTAEFRNDNLISSLLNSSKKEIQIENEKGIVDRISLDKNYKNIFIDGALGKTGLSIENGIAKVHSSSCRNGICKHSILTEVGNIIACAPNKVLIKVV